MPRPDPIQYAERLYGAIRAANFSPISFLAFGNAIKDGVAMRNMPRIAAEPFMRVVGEMLDLEDETADAIIVGEAGPSEPPTLEPTQAAPGSGEAEGAERPVITDSHAAAGAPISAASERRRGRR